MRVPFHVRIAIPFGARQGIAYTMLTPELKAAIDKPETRNEDLSTWLLSVSSNGKLLSRGSVKFEEVEAFGGMPEVSGGSAPVNMATSKRLVFWGAATDLYDTTRAAGNPDDWAKSLELSKPFYRSVSFEP